jgi:HD-like signal output (HDOD) protein
MNRREMLHTLADELGRSQLSFPTSVAATLKVRQTLDDPDCAAEAVARQIQAEPLLAARVVALANSVAYNRSGRLVTDVRSAVNMLGFRTVKTLATVMIARQMAATAQSPSQRGLAAKLWEHTAHVAALAQILARRVTHQDPETALFAGMLHEIGGFYLLYRVKDFPGVLDGKVSDWIGEGGEDDKHSPERVIGRAVLRALAVPEPVTAAIEVLWQGYLAFPPATLGDTLLLAYELSPIKSPLRDVPPGDAQDHPAAIDMLIEQETLGDILRESAAEVTSLVQALQA